MKKLCIILCLLLSRPVFADSPLTSTDFYQAYQDLPAVQMIINDRGLSEKSAALLVDDQTPMDHAAAMVNALGWDFNGKANAVRFVELLRQVRPDIANKIDTSSEPARVLFLRGYMKALDNYFDVAEASEMVKRAQGKLPNDFTVALITTLVIAQDDKKYTWCDRYMFPTGVIQQFHGRQNMRQKAVDIIMEYMILYKEYCGNKTQP
ncbi:MAG: hypothetical protein OEZ39_15255 [Gammaproteobacteria bacterium]|nr:hypothetical protein [Gammaproteobacteria bacterium]MDH5653212.1 hypothetical protein [Gammaproteobacteria bacterium]